MDWKIPDISRESPRHLHEFAPRLLRAVRGHEAVGSGRDVLSRLRRGYWKVAHVFWTAVSGAEIPLGTQIGAGLRLCHGTGIVINGKAKIGVNCLIMHSVTIGLNRGRVPVIGDAVDIGPGAVIIGGVAIGDHAQIGANAVVTCDVPAGGVAVGNPARVIRIDPERAIRGSKGVTRHEFEIA